MELHHPLSDFVAPSSYTLNEHGGAYQRGKPYSTEKKIEVANIYIGLVCSPSGIDPNPTNVAKRAGVDWHTAKKIIDEFEECGRIKSPEEILAERPIPLGVGSQCLERDDESYLEYLYFENPSRTNSSYVSELVKYRGTLVSESLIEKWFLHRFAVSGKFVVPDKTPIDKFRPENLARMVEYGNIIEGVTDKRRLHFLDESKVGGKEISCVKARKDVFHGGGQPTMAVPSDFRDEYNMFASTSAWPDAPHSVEAIFLEDNGDAFSTMAFLTHLLHIGHFRRGDIAVFDRWTGHFHGEAEELENLLWEAQGPDGMPMNILLLLLPARCPELNPIELIFHIVKRRMRNYPRGLGVLGTAVQATLSIDTVLILKTMIHCGYDD